MTPIEKLDLELLKTATTKEKLDAFAMCVEFLRMDEQGLKHTGHKSREAAVFWTIRHAQEHCEKLTRAHVKKYPD